LREFTLTDIVIILVGSAIILRFDGLASVLLMGQLVDLGTYSTLRFSRDLGNNEMVRVVVSVNINIIYRSGTEVSSIVLIMLSSPHSAIGVLNAFDIGFGSHLSLFTGV
jgi:hypothetical protein